MAYNEADHPRDELGRWTDAGSGSKENGNNNDTPVLKGRIEKIQKSPADILYGKSGNIKTKEKEESIYRNVLLNTLGKLATPAVVLYSKTKDLEKMVRENGLIDKLNKNIQQIPLKGQVLYEEIPVSDIKLENGNNNLNWSKDENFNKSLAMVFENEGGFSDDPNDKGGRTNMGITQATYNDYCKRNGLKVKDVKNLTKKEAAELYYNDYWKASGADKIQDNALQYVHFDAAVNHGVGNARKFLKESEGDFDKYIQARKEKYNAIIKKNPSQETFRKGWMNRIDKIEKAKEEGRF